MGDDVGDVSRWTARDEDHPEGHRAPDIQGKREEEGDSGEQKELRPHPEGDDLRPARSLPEVLGPGVQGDTEKDGGNDDPQHDHRARIERDVDRVDVPCADHGVVSPPGRAPAHRGGVLGGRACNRRSMSEL